jgi:DnaJ homolog subfamily C member 19
MLQRLKSIIRSVYGYPRGFNAVMDHHEARQILDIGSQGGSVAERYRELMKINHPDRGGSTYIASKINEAKNLLMGGLPK